MQQQLVRSRQSQRSTILVVDDDEATRESLRDLLESSGLQAALFPSGINLLAASGPLDGCCILLDIELPDCCGFTICERLRSSGIGAPVILMSGRPELLSEARLRAPSAFAVLEKPLHDTLLLQTLDDALAEGARTSR